MARLADLLVKEKMYPPRWAYRPGDPEHNALEYEQSRRFREHVDAGIRAGEVIVADNVAEYYYAGNDREEWDLKEDFPSLAPPFDRFFVEWRRPSRIVSTEMGVRSAEYHPEFVGMFCETRDLGSIGAAEFEAYGGGAQLSGAEVRRRARWWLEATLLCVSDRGTPIGPLCLFVLCIDADGRLIGKHCVMFFGLAQENPEFKVLTRWMGVHLHPLALTLSFFHCKNVELKEQLVAEKLARAYERRHGKPLTRYHILEIEPMKKVLRTEGESEKTGLKRALHICRGHFADYREGRGLFGKHHGKFWVPAHAKGSIKEGVVAKDYAMKAPERIQS